MLKIGDFSKMAMAITSLPFNAGRRLHLLSRAFRGAPFRQPSAAHIPRSFLRSSHRPSLAESTCASFSASTVYTNIHLFYHDGQILSNFFPKRNFSLSLDSHIV